MIALGALVISILTFLFSLSNIKVSMFKERYAIYSKTQKIFSKLLGNHAKVTSVVTENDVEKIKEFILKSKFLFGEDQKVIDVLSNLKYKLEYYLDNSIEKIKKKGKSRSSDCRF